MDRSDESVESVTGLIARMRSGDRSALDQLVPLVYNELHRLAAGYLRREIPGHTLQPTALVNEVYLRLVGAAQHDYQDRVHFYAVAARLMRQILVDHARSKNAAKRGGGAVIVPLETNLDFSPEKASIIVALDDALNTLALADEEKARMVELHYFAGMTAEEVAGFLSTSVHKVRHGLRIALALLHREVNGP